MPLIGVTVAVLQSRNLRGRVTLQVDRKKETTQDHRTFDPAWNEEFYFPVMNSTTLLVESWDDPSFVGRATLDVPAFLQGAPARKDWVPLSHEHKEVGEVLLSVTANADGRGYALLAVAATPAVGTPQTLQVTVRWAEGLSTGDYYVTVSVDDQLVHRTDTKYGTAHPQWEERARLPPLRGGEAVQLVVEDARRGVPAAGTGFAAADLLAEAGQSLELPLESTSGDAHPRLVVRVEAADAPAAAAPAGQPAPFVKPPIILQPPPQPVHHHSASWTTTEGALVPAASLSAVAAGPAAASKWVVLRVEAAEQLSLSSAAFVQLTHGSRSVCTVARPCSGGRVALGTEFAFLLDLMGRVEVELRTFGGLIGAAEVPASEVVEAVAVGHELAVEVGEDDGTVRGLVLLTARFGGPDDVQNRRSHISRVVAVRTHGSLPSPAGSSVGLPISALPSPLYARQPTFSPRVGSLPPTYVSKPVAYALPPTTHLSANGHFAGWQLAGLPPPLPTPGGFLDASPAEHPATYHTAYGAYGLGPGLANTSYPPPAPPQRYAEAHPPVRTAKA